MSPPRSLRHPSLVVLALASAAALAGCTAGGDDESDVLQAARDAVEAGDLVLYLNLTVGDQTYSYSTSDPATPPALQPPGPPPLMVDGSIEARGLPDGSDADLAWSLDWGDGGGFAQAGGDSTAGSANATATAGSPGGNGTASAPDVNGTSLPASARHTYLTEGRHHIQAVLSLAGEELQAIHVPIEVGNATPAIPAGTELGREPFHAEGDLPMSLTGCSADDGQDFPWAFNNTVNGTPANVSRIQLQLDASGFADDTGLQVLDANGTVVAEAEGDGAANALDAAGPFPPGDYTVRVVGCTMLEASYGVDGEATYVAAAASDP